MLMTARESDNYGSLSLDFIIIIINNRGLNAGWCLTPLLLWLPTAAYLGQRGLTPAGLLHTTAQCHLTILGEVILFCLNHPSFQTPGFLSFCCRSFCRYGRRGAAFSVSLSAVGFLPIESCNWIVRLAVDLFIGVVKMLCLGVLRHTACKDLLKHGLIWHKLCYRNVLPVPEEHSGRSWWFCLPRKISCRGLLPWQAVYW